MKRRGSPDHLEVLDLRQRADQFLGKSVREIFVIRVAGIVDQREDGDCLRQRVSPVPVGRTGSRAGLPPLWPASRDGAIESTAGAAPDRFRWIDLAFELQAFRR